MHARTPTSSIEETNKALIQRWIDAADAGFTADFATFFSEDYRGHLSGRTHMDLAELTCLERAFARAFNPIARTLEDLIASGDKVVLRLTTTAHHTGEWQGIPAPGRQVTFTAIVIYRIADERILESWGEVDFASLWRQLTSAALT